MTDHIEAQMAQVLAEMSVISEQHAHVYDSARIHGGEHDRSPKPLSDRPLVDFYRESFNRAQSHAARARVLQEAREALELARKTPLPVGQEPEVGSPQWKRYIAESDEDAGVLARRFWSPRTEKHVTRRYINMVRQQYREAS
jgi:hypothetical protein